MTQSTQRSVQPPSFNVEELNQRFETAHPREILAWCVENIPTGLVQTSAFNADDLVITDILYRDLKLTKIEPLQRGLAELNTVAWITGRRRDQAVTREDMPIFETDGQGRLKINPVATWTRKETWTYIYNYSVIYNPLHDQGYPSIGDEPITTPVVEGEDERAGRWRGSSKTECGIHI